MWFVIQLNLLVPARGGFNGSDEFAAGDFDGFNAATPKWREI